MNKYGYVPLSKYLNIPTVAGNIYVHMFGIVVAELLMFSNNVPYGLGIHMMNLIAIVLTIVLKDLSLDVKNVLQSIILLVLLRIVNLSIPQLFTMTVIQYSLIYGIMFVPIYSVIKNQQISTKELGVDFKRFHIYLPASILIGVTAATLEYEILGPVSLIERIGFTDIILMIIVMFVFVGLVEEIIFRSIIQTRIEKILGPRYGIILSGSMFGVMNASRGIMNEIIFTSVFGIVLGYIFYRTKSLPFLISISGITNIVLFGILPHILA
jgi:uncharacterized protein